MNEPNDAYLLTVVEAAAILRVQPGTIYRWVGQNKLPAVKVGRKMTRFRRSDLERFINEHCTGAGGPGVA